MFHPQAFVLHSWSDDPAAKWAVLQRWRAAFVRVHGKEPELWIDRICIDPAQIGEQLPCLQVYLVSCHTLLALEGPTYLNRLWCARSSGGSRHLYPRFRVLPCFVSR